MNRKLNDVSAHPGKYTYIYACVCLYIVYIFFHDFAIIILTFITILILFITFRLISNQFIHRFLLENQTIEIV